MNYNINGSYNDISENLYLRITNICYKKRYLIGIDRFSVWNNKYLDSDLC